MNDKERDLEELEQYKKKYEVTWLNEIKSTFVLTVGLASLCAILFFALYFTRDLTMNKGTIKRQLNIFDAAISATNAKANLKDLVSEPHLAGTEGSDRNGKRLQEKLLKALGENGKLRSHVQVYTEKYEVLLPFPTTKSFLNLQNGNEKITANLGEAEVAAPSEKTLKNAPYAAWNQSFIAWSANAELDDDVPVYVNYGRTEDFAKLATKVNLEGKVVIARYGKIFRGQIVKNAEDRKCKGVILYSDPQDDGAAVGDVYPEGIWRPEGSLQRGSSMFLAQQPGDPTTPGNPSVPGTRNRIKRSDAKNLPKIPVLAINAADARKFLEKLNGDEVVDADWKGGLGITYRYGSNNNDWKVNMKVENEEKMTTITNYFARIEGGVEPDKQVMLGNHKDAWVYGATDPVSGTVVLLEVAAGLGQMLKNGWQPRRTVVLAFFDAEEAGLIGSVEFVEQYAQKLSNQLVAYLNVDNLQGDVVRFMGSTSLGEVARDVAGLVENPANANNGTALDNWKLATGAETPLPSLPGSGSDYTGFYHHLGVPVLDVSLRQKNGKTYGTYHSIMDNFDYFTRLIDPDMKKTVLVSKLVGKLLLRLADDIVLPLNVAEQAKDIDQKLDALLASDEWKKSVAELPELVQAEVSKATNITERSAGSFVTSAAVRVSEKEILQRLDPQSLNYETRIRVYNDRVQYAERGFVSAGGLPDRKWYKNVISAPGKDLGYGVTVLPALREALAAPVNVRGKLLLDALSDLSDSLDVAESSVTGRLSSRNTQTVG